ncbi:hypothetical protein LSAT2_003176 [Lamellibrachia satsuma]|nr:hypothetical protein LSAT2_003176 [Lamellibrachia satsuma]
MNKTKRQQYKRGDRNTTKWQQYKRVRMNTTKQRGMMTMMRLANVDSCARGRELTGVSTAAERVFTPLTRRRSCPQSTTDPGKVLEKRNIRKHEDVICGVCVHNAVGGHQWRVGIRSQMHQQRR